MMEVEGKEDAMKKFKQSAYSVLGRIYIPEELLGKKPVALHISDTPSAIYGALRSLIRILKPQVIFHTGDLCDHIKLENNENLMDEYQQDVVKILRIMEFSSAKDIHITMGNHDKYAVLKPLVKRSVLHELSAVVKLGDFSYHLSHYYEDVEVDPKDFNLYGHNLEAETEKVRTKWFLNGVMNIHVIELDSGKVHKLRYPWGTNDYRYRRRRRGL